MTEKLQGTEQSSPADVLLIYPYFYTHAPKAMLFHPLGIAQLAAILRGCGLATQVIDCTFDHREAVISKIVHARPRIVGIYAMLSMSENAMALARNIRDVLPETLLVCGGPLPTLKPDQFSALFDAVFCGEADVSFPRFCLDYIQSNSSPGTLRRFVKDPEKYPGLYINNPHDGAPITSTPWSFDEKTLNPPSILDRSDYEHSKYQQFWLDREGFSLAGIMTSYGCPFDCEFCSKPVFGNHFRQCDMDQVFEEIKNIKSLGYTGIWIADDCFCLDPAYAREFCHRMISEELDMKWFCLSRVDRMTSSDIALWQDAGCRKVFFGLESGSNDILKLMNKKTTTEEAEKTIHRFAQSDIRTAGFFMVGYPGETYDTIETTFKWALSLPLDEISFTVPYPLPGTRLYDRVTPVKENPDWRYENENRLVFQSEFDEAYLKKRIDSVYKQFNATRAPVKVRMNQS
ncbi:MAG: radical SAM protein [Desulfamplus sp.]|nr:radical SAM protein [Desulfamplus sp.]